MMLMMVLVFLLGVLFSPLFGVGGFPWSSTLPVGFHFSRLVWRSNSLQLRISVRIFGSSITNFL